jgi:hypothetical protein
VQQVSFPIPDFFVFPKSLPASAALLFRGKTIAESRRCLTDSFGCANGHLVLPSGNLHRHAAFHSKSREL